MEKETLPNIEKINQMRRNLPIFQYKDQIIDIITKHQFCIITGDTGSGKSTQLPQYILDSPQIYQIFYSEIDKPQIDEKQIESKDNNKNNNNNDHNDKAENNQEKPQNEDEENQQFKQQEKDFEKDKNHNETQIESAIVPENLEKFEEQESQSQQWLIQQKSERLQKLDKACHDKLRLVITQPRRVAAISMAKRICFQRSVKLSQEVGYSIRFDDHTSENTYLRYVTDGILVRECLLDPDLSRYNVVILDEAHERSLYTDILFALVKQAVLRRKGKLKLIITSATLNTQQFSNFFQSCPVLQMEGRSYPVDIQYGPCLANQRVEQSVVSAIRMHLHEGPGDILVFLTGSEECELARKICYEKLQNLVEKGREVPNMLIYTLYGSLSSDDQSLVFHQPDDSESTRKLIFATNIAETSLTIDNIGFVIDCGYVKQQCYNPHTGMDSLIVVPISKVQAIQRAGRAGRTQVGKCFRMYSQQFFLNEMKEQTIPEILRVNLANVILNLQSMNIHDVIQFDYMEPPDIDSMLNALRHLFLLDAIDADGKISQLGLEMCRFPLEPSYSKSLISSMLMNCEDDMVTLVSLLSAQQIYNKPSQLKEEQYQLFEKKTGEFFDMDGDHQSLIKIYKRWVRNQQSDYFCRENFLNTRALKMAENIKHQLKDIMQITRLSVCKKFYEHDHLYNEYLKANKSQRDTMSRHPQFGYSNGQNQGGSLQLKEKTHEKKKDDEKEQLILEPSEVFRMALATGFYFNSARQMHNTDCSYLLIYPEGNVVEVDPQSVYSRSNFFPDYVIFTELGGSSSYRGFIRTLSIVENDWIKGYSSRLAKVDLFRLAGMQFEENTKRDLIEKKQKDHEDEKRILELEEQIKREEQINEAKARFNQRKKIQTDGSGK